MSQYDPDGVAAYFDQYGEQEWERLVRTPVEEVKLHIHTHYLQTYLTPGMRVLEIGAGAGRFTQVLAGLGCKVLVGDISQGQLDLNRQHAEALGFAHAVEGWQQLDICDLGALAGESFDAAVCYGGPLSYVFEQRESALGECIRVTAHGGLILLSVMSLWGSVHALLPAIMPLPIDLNRKIICTGDTTESSHRCHLYRADELKALLTRKDLALLAVSASNCLSTGWESALAEIRQDDEKWRELLHLEVEACGQAANLGMGTHLIAVARRT